MAEGLSGQVGLAATEEGPGTVVAAVQELEGQEDLVVL